MISKIVGILAVIALLKMTAASVQGKVEGYGTTTLPQTSHEIASQSLPELASMLSHIPTSASQNKYLLSSQSRSMMKRRRKNNKPINDKSAVPAANATNSTLIEKSDGDVQSEVKFEKRHPLKPITDLIMYGMKRDVIEPRTGLMLFGAITAIEVVVGTTLLFGLSGMAIAALVAMVKFLLAGSMIMMG